MLPEGTSIMEHDYNSPGERLQYLRDNEGNHLDPTAHHECPGHGYDTRLEPIHKHDDEEAVQSRIDEVAEMGGIAIRGKQHYLMALPCCTDWKKYGHQSSWRPRSEPQGEDIDPEERKAERRRVIENNKEWDAAQEVRREWLIKFSAAKKAPAGANQLTAEAIQHYRIEHPRKFTAALPDDNPATASPGRAAQISLMYVLSAWESSADRYTWRNPTDWDRRILAAMADWGHKLAPIEQQIINGTN